jgi:hypothetical protein
MTDSAHDCCNRITRHVAHARLTASAGRIDFEAAGIRIEPIARRPVSLPRIPKVTTVPLTGKAVWVRLLFAQEFEAPRLEAE